MSEKNKHNIKILGNTYTIKSDKSEDFINRLTDKINSRLSELRKANPSLKQEMLLSLALLYFSEEVTDTEDELVVLRDKVDGFDQEKRSIINKSDSYLKNIDSLNKEKEELKNEIEIYTNSIKKLNDDIDSLKLEMQNNIAELDNKNRAIQKLNETNSNLRKEYTQMLIIVNSVKRELEKVKGKVM